MAELEVFLKSYVELAAQVFDVLGRLVLLHVAEVGDLAGRHRGHLAVTTSPRALATRKVLLLYQVACRLSTAEHSRVVLMCRGLWLRLLAVAAHDGEALFIGHVTLASLWAVLA